MRRILNLNPNSGKRFNSRTREDATFKCQPGDIIPGVSIHAPVRMRPKVTRSQPKRHVSIHAPVRMRLLVIFLGFVFTCFNSRTREDAT